MTAIAPIITMVIHIKIVIKLIIFPNPYLVIYNYVFFINLNIFMNEFHYFRRHILEIELEYFFNRS